MAITFPEYLEIEQEGGENEYHAGVKNDEEEYHSTSSEEPIPTPVRDRTRRCRKRQ